MADRKALQKMVVQALQKIDFAGRYFAFCDTGPESSSADFTLEQQRSILAKTGGTFRYHRSERFFAHRDSQYGHQFRLHVAIRDGVVEFIFLVDIESICVGGVYSDLANQVASLTGTASSARGPYPVPIVQTTEQLEESIRFGWQLYTESCDAVHHALVEGPT
jgi:hypothetical protein